MFETTNQYIYIYVYLKPIYIYITNIYIYISIYGDGSKPMKLQ